MPELSLDGSTWLPEPMHLDRLTRLPEHTSLDKLTMPSEPRSRCVDLAADEMIRQVDCNWSSYF